MNKKFRKRLIKILSTKPINILLVKHYSWSCITTQKQEAITWVKNRVGQMKSVMFPYCRYSVPCPTFCAVADILCSCRYSVPLPIFCAVSDILCRCRYSVPLPIFCAVADILCRCRYSVSCGGKILRMIRNLSALLKSTKKENLCPLLFFVFSNCCLKYQ